MLPQRQAFKHDPENGSVGDCLRTCIASVLDIDRDEVPHFAKPISKTGSEVTREINEWLAPQGLYYVDLPFQAPTLDALLTHFSNYNPDLHYILCAKGASGVGHVVVCKNDKVVMNPANSSIVGPIDGYWWISVIAKKV